MDWICEAPEENQWGAHDNLRGIVDTVIKRHALRASHSYDAFDWWMPLNAGDSFVFTELEISERLVLLFENKIKFLD